MYLLHSVLGWWWKRPLSKTISKLLSKYGKSKASPTLKEVLRFSFFNLALASFMAISELSIPSTSKPCFAKYIDSQPSPHPKSSRRGFLDSSFAFLVNSSIGFAALLQLQGVWPCLYFSLNLFLTYSANFIATIISKVRILTGVEQFYIVFRS